MAYFSNSSDGSCFDAQCGKCKYGQSPCPIALVQMAYNYDACNNDTATKILNDLVKNDGTCEMYKMCEQDFFVDENQLSIGD
jgi:hypothetical protein